jgi:hypothetical protein
MTNELDIFTGAASTETFMVLSAIFALAYAAWALWIVGQTSEQTRPASPIRGAL